MWKLPGGELPPPRRRATTSQQADNPTTRTNDNDKTNRGRSSILNQVNPRWAAPYNTRSPSARGFGVTYILRLRWSCKSCELLCEIRNYTTRWNSIRCAIHWTDVTAQSPLHDVSTDWTYHDYYTTVSSIQPTRKCSMVNIDLILYCGFNIDLHVPSLPLIRLMCKAPS